MKKDELIQAVRDAAVEKGGRMTLPCAKAFDLADRLGVEIIEVGAACNQEKIRIVRCQLGCFS